MMLIEQAPVPQGVLPVAEFKDHLRLGSGFADDGQQDALAAGYLRAALAAIEGRIGKALIQRRFWLSLAGWRELGEQTLPLAPVQAVVSVTLVAADGAETPVPGGWRLLKDAQRPRIVAAGVLLPPVPLDGAVEIVFEAGFGPAWSDVPADLRQAVLLLAAQYYEMRNEAARGEGAMPFGVMALIERWRTVRVLGGGAR